MEKKILIVDDNPKNLKLLQALLKMSGYKTIEATNGKAGVKLAKSKKPDLILMDVMMPVMDGLEAARILKADTSTRDIPIMALTSQAMKGDKERVFEAGYDEYITKPFNIKDLLGKVAEYLPSEEKSVLSKGQRPIIKDEMSYSAR